MDWEAMLAPQSQDDIDDDEDFYGYGEESMGDDADAGAAPPHEHGLQQTMDAIVQQTEATEISVAEQQKLDNQRRADELRAKLLAQRQAASRANTPAKSARAPQIPANTSSKMEVEQPSSDALGLETLLAQGKAAAEAKAATTTRAQLSKPSNGHPPRQPREKEALAVTAASNSQPANNLTSSQRPPRETESSTRPPPQRPANKSSTAFSDDYYADLSIWLEMTGYHDVDFRNSKLAANKERKQLEEEAARIAERLEKLKQAERANAESLRSSTAHIANGTTKAPPPLPVIMPNGYAARAAPHTPMTNGSKRPHSPEPMPADKAGRRAEEPGFRVRGADDATRPGKERRGATSNPLDRRVSYPDGRRRSLEDRRDTHSRDPPLERRQAYYRRDNEPRAFEDERYDQYATSGEATRLREKRGAGYNGVSYHPAPEYRELAQYRSSVGLDLRKGGVRYFMIKSWNHGNVRTAMRDSVWATQIKNEQTLLDAYHTSRHVILLFSVNRSMAFQGFALMTSAPNPKLPKPSWCAELNWGTSSAFTLQWLATTPVHFRFVGHLKNTFNIDEKGDPIAVLVGKDGQEISEDAGRGTVVILNEAESAERGRLLDGRDLS